MEATPPIVAYASLVLCGIDLIAIIAILVILIRGKIYRLGKFLDEALAKNAALQETGAALRKPTSPCGEDRSQ